MPEMFVAAALVVITLSFMFYALNASRLLRASWRREAEWKSAAMASEAVAQAHETNALAQKNLADALERGVEAEQRLSAEKDKTIAALMKQIAALKQFAAA